jgi:hypothetical protein
MHEIIRMDGIFDAAAKGDTRTVRTLVKLRGSPLTIWGELTSGLQSGVATRRRCGRWWRAART